MNYEEIRQAAFEDEMNKIAAPAWVLPVMGGASIGTGVVATVVGMHNMMKNPQVQSELRDPRLYSNLRGMATFESREKRIAKHKSLGKGDGTIKGAFKAGWSR